MKVLVTGGGGFLGLAIVRALIERGDSVRSFSRGRHHSLTELGVEQQQGDLADPAAVCCAVAGCQLVFHVAAKAGIWGRFQEYFDANVIGAQNVLDACRRNGVQRLVYTSTPSVVFDGCDMTGADESVPYPTRYLSHYPATKADAERRVLAANSSDLATVALRPHLIWGPGDTNLVPRILKRGRKGNLRRLGQCNPLIDTTYIDDAVAAHLLAADCLDPAGPACGRTYFVSSGQPVPVWDMVNSILAADGQPPVTRSVPVSVAYATGAILEAVYWLFGLSGEPRMTRFLAKELSTAHWFDISAARRDLGYEPKVTIEQGLRCLSRALNSARVLGD